MSWTVPIPEPRAGLFWGETLIAVVTSHSLWTGIDDQYPRTAVVKDLKRNIGVTAMGKTTCADVGDFPADYSSLLPKHANVPSSETEPAGKTWYFPIRLDAAHPTGVFVPPALHLPEGWEESRRDPVLPREQGR